MAAGMGRQTREMLSALGDNDYAPLAPVAGVQPIGVLLELLVPRKLPAALGLDHESQELRLDLDVGAPGARLGLLQAPGCQLALLDPAPVRLTHQRSREVLTSGQASADGVRDVVLFVAQEVEHGFEAAAAEGEVSHLVAASLEEPSTHHRLVTRAGASGSGDSSPARRRRAAEVVHCRVDSSPANRLRALR